MILYIYNVFLDEKKNLSLVKAFKNIKYLTDLTLGKPFLLIKAEILIYIITF